MVDDRKMISKCLSGDQQAFASLVDKYKSLVCSLAYCMTGRVDVSEDIAQDVFICVWKNLSALKDHNKFRAWLASITRNAVKHYLRDVNTSPKTTALDIEHTDVANNSEDPVQATITGEENALIWQTLQALPEEYREAMVLYYRHEKSTSQVAEMMEITPDTVRQRLSRGREMIRQEIERKLETGLKNTAPGKKFTASVIAAISTIPIGSAITEASVSTAAVAQSPWAAAVSSVFSAAAVKIAAILITVAAITAGIILTRHTASEPIVPMPQQTPVETHGSASPPTPTTATDLAATPNPEPAINTPDPVETHGSASPTPDAPAAPEGFTPRGVLSGLITDIKTGEPVIDAAIEILLPNGETEIAHVDENGFYYFDTLKSYGICKIAIDSTEYVGLKDIFDNKLSLNIPQDAKIIKDIQLEKACMLEIETVDEHGEPIKDVKVTTWGCSEFGYYEKEYNFSKKTDNAGKIMVGGIMPAEYPYVINLLHNRYEKNANGESVAISDYAPARQTVLLDNAEMIQNVKVVMNKGFDIDGQVLFSDGTPASNYTVSVKPEWWHSESCLNFTTNTEGLFTIENIDAGDHKITYSDLKDKYRPSKTISLMLNKDMYINAVVPERKSKTISDPTELTIFSGKLLFEDDCGVSEVCVSGKNDYESFRETVKIEGDETDFVINNIVPGVYDIHIRGDFLRSKINSIQVEEVTLPCDNFVQTLKCLSRSDITASVIDDVTKKPITNFKVMHQMIHSHVSGNISQADDWTEYAQSSDGKFTLKSQEEGCHRFIITSNSYSPFTKILNTSESTDFVAELTTGTVLNGKVVNSKGEAISRAEIIPLTINCRGSGRDIDFATNNPAAVSDNNGGFILEKLPEKSETIKIVHPDYNEKIIQIELPETVNDAVITLSKGGSIEGYVYDNSGNIVPNCPLSIKAISSSDLPKAATTDGKGYYKFDNIPAGMQTIRQSYLSNSTHQCGIMAVDEQIMQLNLGGKSLLTGKVYINGLPLADAKISVVSPYLFYSSIFNYKSRTNSDGSFQFSGIPGGRKKLIYTISNAQGNTRLIAEFDTKGQNLDLGYIFINCVDIEVNIDTSGDSLIDRCEITKDIEYLLLPDFELTRMLPVGGNKFEAPKVNPGRYILNVERDDMPGVFMFEIIVENDGKPASFDFKLPQANATLYGKTDAQTNEFVCRRDDFSFYVKIDSSSSGMYKIKNMPPGKYVVETYHTGTEVAAFELEENQSFELNLETIESAVKQLNVVDFQNKQPLHDYSSWLEADGVRYEIRLMVEIGVPPGIYTLYITKPGYKDYSQIIDMTQKYTKGTCMEYITAILERQ